MEGVEGSFGCGVKDFHCRNEGACRKDLDIEPAAARRSDIIGKTLGELVKEQTSPGV